MKVTFGGSNKAQRHVIDNGLEVHYADAQRNGYRYRWYMLIILVSAPIIYLLWIIMRPYILILAPGIITTEPLQVRAANTAMVSNVLVKSASDFVRGDILLILENSEIDAQIDELKAQLLILDERWLGHDEVTISALKSRILVAQKGVKEQSELLTSYYEFREKGVVPTADMATVLQTNLSAKMALEQAKIDLLREIEQQAMDKIAGTVAQLRNSIQLELAQLIAKQRGLIIQAPFSGKIEDIMVQKGERVAVEQPLLWLASREQPIVLTYVNEKYLEYVQIGQKARIRLPGGEVIRAEVSEPTQLVSKIPSSLSGPFDGQKSALKVTLSLKEELVFSVEGLPVEVRFYHYPNLWE